MQSFSIISIILALTIVLGLLLLLGFFNFLGIVKNKMEYRILRQVLDSQAYVTISESEYNDITIARDGLVESLYLEEKFDIVLENIRYSSIKPLMLNTCLVSSNIFYTNLF